MMKKIIKTMLAFAAVLLCGGAWAAAPVAVWENLNVSDDALTQNGMTLNLNLGSGETNNKIVNKTAVQIGDKPITVTFGNDGFTDYKATVIVKYSGISAIPAANTAIATFKAGTYDDLIGIHVVGSTGKIKGISGSNTWGSESASVLPSDGANHMLAVTAKMTKNTDTTLRGTYAYIDGTQVYGQGGLVGSECIIKNVAIGGENKANSLPALSGMIVEKIAVFNAVLSQTEAANYKWPSETVNFSATISSDDTWGNITWDDSKIWDNDYCGDAVINVSANAKLTINTEVSAKKVTFDIAEGKTLTLAGQSGVKISTSDNVYVVGKGTVRFDDSTGGFYAVGGSSVKLDLATESTMELYRANTWNYSGCDFTAVTGAGTIKLSGTNWQCIPSSGAIWPLTHPVVNTLTSGMILSAGNTTYTMANYSGNGDVSTTNGSNARNLTIVQSEDLTWSGTLAADGSSRFGTFTVQGSGEHKTLTYTGDNSSKQAGALTVDVSGSMKMNGTWKAKNVVAINGEFGGSGSITGNGTITIGVGAKIRADWNGTNGPVTLFAAPTMGALVDVVATEVPAGNKIKLFSGAFMASEAITHARIFVGEAVHYGTVSIEADGVYATVSDAATTDAMDAAAKYKYEMDGSFENSSSSGVNLTVGNGVSFAAGDFRDNQVLKLGTNPGSHWGSAGFAFGSDEWTIVTVVKAPTATQCIFGVGGESGTSGLLGLRSANSNQVEIFTAGGTRVTGVTVADSTTAFHVYTIVYQDGKIKMNVDGGEFTTPVAFTPGTATQWQFGGVYRGCPSGTSNANSGEMDAWRLYSYPFVKADSKVICAEFIPAAKIGDKGYATLADAITAAKSGDVIKLVKTVSENISIPTGVTVATSSTAQLAGTVSGQGTVVFDGYAPSSAQETSFKSSDWTGTVWLKNKRNWTYIELNNYGNASSTVKLTNIHGHLTQYADVTPMIELEDEMDGDTLKQALEINNGWSDYIVVLNTIKGSGTIDLCGGPVKMLIKDWADFDGTAKVSGSGLAGLLFGDVNKNTIAVGNNSTHNKKITILAGNTVTIASKKTWIATGGFVVNGTVKGSGTLGSATTVAAGATIDLSAIGSTETAFITGNVTVNAATKIYFPANWTAGTAMKLCSGTISGVETSGEVDVKIGEKTEHVILSYDSEDGTVSYGYAPTAQTWTNGTIIFDGDLHHLTANEDGTYTKTIGDVTYTINLNGHELKTEDGKSYILIKEDANNSGLGVIVSRASATGNTGAMVAMRYSDYPAYDSTHPIRVAMTIQGNAGSPYNNTAVGFLANSSGNMQSGWADFYGGKKDGAANDSSLADGDGVLAMTYAKFVARDATNQGIRIFQNTDGSWKTVYSNSTLSGSGTDNITSVAIGGLCTAHVSNNNTRQGDGATVAAGMKVYAVAVSYSPALTNGDASLTSLVWPSEANAEAKIGKTLFDTVEEAITAATTGENKTVSLNKDIAAGASIEIPEGITLDIKGHELNRAVTGSGVLIINKNITRTSTQNEDNDVNLPSVLTTSLKDANNWHGEVVLVGGFDHVQMNPLFNLCNSSSKLTSKGNKGWLLQNSLQNIKLNLVDDGTTPAFYISNSSYQWKYKMKLSGEGTLKVDSASNTPIAALLVTDASDFRGNINMTDLSLYFGSDGDVAGTGLIKINSGTTMKVYPGKIWHAGPGGIEVAGTIKGSGTLEGTVSFDTGSTLDLTDGMLTATTATAAGAFTVKVSNLAEFLSGEKKVMTLTAGGNTIAAAQVTVTDGTNNAPTTYVLKVTPTAAVLVEPASHTWTGLTDGSLNNAANWGVDEMFSGDNQFVVFPADATTKTVSVSDITLGKITINGAYTFTGKGTITLSELEFGNEGSLVLGTGTTLKFPGALDKSLLSKITFAGGNIAVKEVPHFSQTENITVDPTAYTTQGGHLLISWTDFMTHGEFGYGLPMLNSTALNPGATKTNHATATLGEVAWGDNGSKARLLGMYGKIYLEVRTVEQLARKPIRILPLGDSITEGYNKTGNCANYRTQLAAKLSMAGYMVETLGYHYVRSRMPSGEWAPVEWQYHAGVSAQRVWTQRPTSNGVEYNNRAGDMEALETTLNACGGTPDVVLVKLGTNDIGRSDDKDHIYDGLKKILTAVHKKFPDAKVITTTAVNYKSNNQIRKDYNALIRNAFADGGEFTTGDYDWLYFVDQCKIVGNGTDDGSYNDMEGRRLFIDDDTHPDWAGHDLMSDGWYEKIVDIIEVNDGKDKPAKTACKLGAKANVPAAYLDGFTRYRQLDIDEEAAYPQTAFDDYTWKSKKTVTGITKVGYFMELVRKDSGEHTFVWVDMDNFGNDTVQSFGLPTTATTQRSVSKLHVYSNLGCIHNVEANDDTVNGYIEFSPFNATASAVTGAPTKLWDSMDWNDTYATSGAGRGAMQIHRVKKVGDKLWNGAEVLFAYNNWGSANIGVAGTKAGEIGIGNFAQHYVGDHTANGNGQEINELYGANTINIGGGEASNNVSVDYTATRFSPVGDKVNAKAYEVMRLEIWVKGTVDSDAEEPVVITTIPEAGVAIAPGDDVKVPTTTGFEKIKVVYKGVDLTEAVSEGAGQHPKYINVTINNTTGAVELDTTAAAKPTVTAMAATTEDSTDKVTFKLTPIPGLFYSVETADTPEFTNATPGTAEQAKTGDETTLKADVDLTGQKKVQYFRVRVKATK